MTAMQFLDEMISHSATTSSSSKAMTYGSLQFEYPALDLRVRNLSGIFRELGVERQARIALLLPNCPDFVISAFACSRSELIFVPINPIQRYVQIRHILKDSGATVLITTNYLYAPLANNLAQDLHLKIVLLVDQENDVVDFDYTPSVKCLRNLTGYEDRIPSRLGKSSDTVALLYTSGSTGRAKGVVISHRNLIDGARIVSSYLGNNETDRVLAVLPLSFDYGFSQVTTSFWVGGEVVLTNYSMPQRLIHELDHYKINILAGVPTMWTQLCNLNWPSAVTQRLRIITNSGGKVPRYTLHMLQQKLPRTEIFLMYGLTEAFRSTFLNPKDLEHRPDSIGKAIPEVRVNVVRKDGSLCKPNEPGELVHSGALVTNGYWHDPVATARRFRNFPPAKTIGSDSEMSVWSGDIVEMDSDGYLYFIERSDNMIKASGYRISPAEIEEVVNSTGQIAEVLVVGLPDDHTGQRIAMAVVPKDDTVDVDFLIRHTCARELPPYMQPSEIIVLKELPKTANRKFDRQSVLSLFNN